MVDLVELASFVDRAEALIAEGVLKANGIVALAPESYTLAADPGLIFALGGHRVLVRADQLNAARALLNDIEAARARGDFNN